MIIKKYINFVKKKHKKNNKLKYFSILLTFKIVRNQI